VYFIPPTRASKSAAFDAEYLGKEIDGYGCVLAEGDDVSFATGIDSHFEMYAQNSLTRYNKTTHEESSPLSKKRIKVWYVEKR
jgi:hypothetical protein